MGPFQDLLIELSIELSSIVFSFHLQSLLLNFIGFTTSFLFLLYSLLNEMLFQVISLRIKSGIVSCHAALVVEQKLIVLYQARVTFLYDKSLSLQAYLPQFSLSLQACFSCFYFQNYALFCSCFCFMISSSCCRQSDLRTRSCLGSPPLSELQVLALLYKKGRTYKRHNLKCCLVLDFYSRSFILLIDNKQLAIRAKRINHKGFIKKQKLYCMQNDVMEKLKNNKKNVIKPENDKNNMSHKGSKIQIKRYAKHKSFYQNFANAHDQKYFHGDLKKSSSFLDFKHKLSQFLHLNQPHSKMATRYNEGVGLRDYCQLSNKNKKKKSQSDDDFRPQKKRRKNIKDYLAARSEEKRRKHQINEFVQFYGQDEENKIERRSQSIFMINKNRQNCYKKSELSLQIPIHHTQSYFFKKSGRKMSKNNSNEQKMIQPIKVSQNVKKVREDQLRKITPSIPQIQRQPEVERIELYIDETPPPELEEFKPEAKTETQVVKQGQSWKGKKIMIKKSKGLRLYSQKQIRQDDFKQLSPWQKQKTLDSQLYQ